MARYLIDTNVLLRAAAPKSSQHAEAVQAIKRLVSRGEEPLLTPQVLVEFWSVAKPSKLGHVSRPACV